jgi:hypothetical protein
MQGQAGTALYVSQRGSRICRLELAIVHGTDRDIL